MMDVSTLLLSCYCFSQLLQIVSGPLGCITGERMCHSLLPFCFCCLQHDSVTAGKYVKDLVLYMKNHSLPLCCRHFRHFKCVRQSEVDYNRGLAVHLLQKTFLVWLL